MSTLPAVYVLITTYHDSRFPRNETALRTIQAVKKNLRYENYGFYISDDGSTDPAHVESLVAEASENKPYYLYNGQRRGVGHGMNYCMRHLFSMGVELVMILEDDWELTRPLDLNPYVNLLMNNDYIGMIRMGYMSAGLSAEMISAEGHLWWKFYRGNYQYTYAGHASLRHRRLHDAVGLFSEPADRILSPGQNELDFCYKYNTALTAPSIVWPAEYGQWGPFAHIGSVSLADVIPGD